jgi:hypothetical protein
VTSREPTPAPPPTCSCEQPLPRIRAERKGAATTICDRCGLPARLSLDAA